MEKLYTANATAVAGRNGHAETSDGRLKVMLTQPVNPQRPATGTDPEQLFACAYAACYGGAVEFVAKQRKASLTQPVQVDSEVSLLKRAQGGFIIGVSLTVRLYGVTQEEGEIIAQEAHHVCPYSNSIRGNVDVGTRVVAMMDAD